MRRVHEQCGAQHSTEAIAQPAARRPEAQAKGHAQKIKLLNNAKMVTILR
ncbi:MAG: hypothetical protein NZ455_00230 [Bacteroidia bacterium]|nr:hypothetical protein [Bacteroidia bacterium]